MKIHLERYAAWAAVAFQTIGRDFDAELLLRPGGSIIAIVVWLYTKANTIALRFGIHLGAKARKPRSAIGVDASAPRRHRFKNAACDAVSSATVSVLKATQAVALMLTYARLNITLPEPGATKLTPKQAAILLTDASGPPVRNSKHTHRR
jgi:hypothetical protein